LREAGHAVRLAAPQRFANLAGQYDVAFTPLPGDPEEVSRLLNDAGGNALRATRVIREHVFSITAEVSRASFLAAEGADLLVHSFLFTTGMHSWAREHGLPDVSVQTFPVFARTRAFPNVAFSWVPPGPFSYLTHWLTDQAMWYGGNSGYRPARHAHPEISYPSRLYWPFRDSPGRPRTPLLLAYSPTVLPRPVEWGADVHITGYFFLEDEAYQPPEALARFLEAGPAPVCITFGSMINREVEKIQRIVSEAVAKTGNRAVFLTGWGEWGTPAVSKNVLTLESAPHDWLLPRCKAMVHHGGAGTTAAGLRAGIPNIIIPHAVDQPFWAKRVAALGAGPAPLPLKRLTTASLVTALERADDPALRARAGQVGEQIRAEDGVGEAVRLIEAAGG
jgi:sterol 3beta-glucosyltransferase